MRSSLRVLCLPIGRAGEPVRQNSRTCGADLYATRATQTGLRIEVADRNTVFNGSPHHVTHNARLGIPSHKHGSHPPQFKLP